MGMLAEITALVFPSRRRMPDQVDDPRLVEAIRESEELLETKRRLITFTNDLDAGRLGGNQKILHLRPNVLERAYLGTQRTGQEGDRDT